MLGRVGTLPPEETRDGLHVLRLVQTGGCRDAHGLDALHIKVLGGREERGPEAASRRLPHSRSASTTPTSSATSEKMRAWFCPIDPTPTMLTRMSDDANRHGCDKGLVGAYVRESKAPTMASKSAWVNDGWTGISSIRGRTRSATGQSAARPQLLKATCS